MEPRGLGPSLEGFELRFRRAEIIAREESKNEWTFTQITRQGLPPLPPVKNRKRMVRGVLAKAVRAALGYSQRHANPLSPRGICAESKNDCQAEV